MKLFRGSLLSLLVLALCASARAGSEDRPLRYHPDSGDFVIVNGDRRFNRPLYGPQHTGFRVEAGDRPEFSLYGNAKCGTLQFGIITPTGDRWLSDAKTITARYRPGSMLYEIRDPALGESAVLKLSALTTDEAEGVVVRAELVGTPSGPVTLVFAYGGASGAKFERGGDLIAGRDLAPHYRLRPEDCQGNTVQITGTRFTLTSGSAGPLYGIAPEGATFIAGDASGLASPKALLATHSGDAPLAVGQVTLTPGKPGYLTVERGNDPATTPDNAAVYATAEKRRAALAGRVMVDTPDPYINASAGAICVAADAIWEAPHYMHGANAWRSPLLGWRGPYAADVLGWHDRARTHFTYWANKQNIDATDVPRTARPDPRRNLSENDGKMLHSYGSIPATHYDMSLVYIDALLRHLLWTGDREYLRQVWPTIKRHLAWEKRVLEREDGLFEAYCCIWASDAMQYNGGGTTHATAYNYLHFQMAARLAKLVGDDPTPYAQEAARIHAAMQKSLWLPDRGWYGEYKDILGLKRVHPATGVYTVYHTIDSDAADPFQAYQMLRYVDTQIPHISICGPGVPEGCYSVVSTSNWLPYQWSLNNVVLAEVAHTALAYWEAGRPDAAWSLWKGGMLDAMYMGATPGDLPNLSQYDVNRGESYRDFGDAVGISSRTLIQGLFGIRPDALAGELLIQPGYPQSWDHASIRTPDVAYSYHRNGETDAYEIVPHFSHPMRLRLRIPARTTQIALVTLNGKPTHWRNADNAIGAPVLEVDSEATSDHYTVTIHWRGASPATAAVPAIVAQGAPLKATFGAAHLLAVNDPQKTLGTVTKAASSLTGTATGIPGDRTAFAQVRQGDLTWWLPLAFEVRPAFEIIPSAAQDADLLRFRLRNNTTAAIAQDAAVRFGGQTADVALRAPADGGTSEEIVLPTTGLLPGTIPIQIALKGGASVQGTVTDWKIMAAGPTQWRRVDLTPTFNDRVTQIFKNDYLSPRSPYCSLQIPIHGIGEWTGPFKTAEIDDSGLRSKAGTSGEITLPMGIPFRTPGASDAKNIAFTSQWDNYPRDVTVPLTGKASHAYLLMAGSTDPMQSRFENGEVIVTYTDGTTARLALENPTNWWPIEQDYVGPGSGPSFARNGAIPPRIPLSTGEMYFPDDTTKSDRNGIRGGAATVLDLPLDPVRPLKSITVRTLANDDVIGLMGVTLALKK